MGGSVWAVEAFPVANSTKAEATATAIARIDDLHAAQVFVDLGEDTTRPISSCRRGSEMGSHFQIQNRRRAHFWIVPSRGVAEEAPRAPRKERQSASQSRKEGCWA